MDKTTQTRVTITLAVITLATLKLTGLLDISWWAVTAPIWIPYGLVLIVCMFILFAGLLITGMAYMSLMFTRINPNKTNLTEEEFKQLINKKYDKATDREKENKQSDAPGGKSPYR
jgi:hypothetical protein